MTNENTNGWQFDRRVSLGVIVQLVLLASLIVGSWVNLQRQLDIVQHDINLLLQSQRDWQNKLDGLNERCVSYEYRLRAIEKQSTPIDKRPMN
jgi:hypothetical protein